VVINRHPEIGVHRSVDKPQAILLPLLNLDSGVLAPAVDVFVGAVQKQIVGWRRWGTSLQVRFGLQIDLEDRLIIPICYREYTEVDIVVGRRRSVDDNLAGQTLAILGAMMRMIPGRAELRESEIVCPFITRGNRACAQELVMMGM